MYAELVNLLARREEALRVISEIEPRLKTAANAAMDDPNLDEPTRLALVDLRGALAANSPGEVERIASHLLRAAANAEAGELNGGR